MKTILALLLASGLAGGLFVWSRSQDDAPDAPAYRTVTAAPQDIAVKIAASGTIEPEEIVDVGAQIAGKITAFGSEPGSDPPKAIDYGSQVEPGTVLARIDDALYAAEVQLARSEFQQAEHQQRGAANGVSQAKANLRRAEADVVRIQSTLRQAEQNQRRNLPLFQRKAISDQEYELSETAVSTAKAQLAVGEATVDQQQAALEAAEIAVGEAKAKLDGAAASLRKAEKNLEYTTIRSPIRGVIVDRRVNIGQTVVSNLNAPSLFLIAKDLRRLEVWASVNEADIGQIRVGLPVEFTVDAFPGESFRGNVKQIRLNATMTQSVVTYTVVVAVDNASGKLLPYLTANVRFVVAEKSQVMSLPAAAIRWKPKPEQVAAEFREQYEAQAARKGKRDVAGPTTKATVWVLVDDFVRPVEITTGLADTTQVEIVSGDLPRDAQIVTGEAPAVRKQTKNPFAPSLTSGL